MGSELFAAPFKVAMFHPHEKCDFIDYEMKGNIDLKYLPEIKLLTDAKVLKPVDLLMALEMMSEMLIDYEMYERVLPLATIMIYVASELVKSNPYVVKGKILKAIACTHLGYIAQAIKIAFKSFPAYTTKEEMLNSITNYSNDITQSEKVSPLVNVQFLYLKSLILLTSCTPPFASDPLDTSQKHLSTAFDILSTCLSQLSTSAQISTLKTKISTISVHPHQDARTGKYLDFLKRKLKRLLPEDAAPPIEEDLPSSWRRSCSLSWELRCRFRLLELSQRKGSLLEAFYLGRETLLEISKWNMPAGVNTQVERKWPDEKFGVVEEVGLKKDKKEEKKEKPKEEKKKGKNEEVDEDLEEDKQFEMEDERIWTEMNLDKGEKSELPGAYMWAMAKYAYIEVIFKQGRYDEVIAQINAAKLELEELNDTFFMRLYYEILTMIKVHQGDLEGSKSMFDGLKAYAERLGHDDIRLAQFYGNMAEFFYLSYPEKAVEIFKESRVLFWINLKNRGLKVIDIYEHIDLEKGSVKEQKIPDSQEEKEKPKVPVEEKKDAKQKGKVDPKAEASVEKDYSNIEKIITFSKEMNYEFFMIDDKEGLKLNKKNDTYILNLDGLVKVNLRYSQALCTLDTKYDLAIIVLKETLRLLDR